MRKIIYSLVAASCFLLSSSCRDYREISNPSIIDNELSLTREDYKSIGKNKEPAESSSSETPTIPPVPDISDIIMPPPELPEDKLITISVTEEIPIKEVFMELSRKADIDIEIDPGIQGGIIFRAKDRPFSEVIERVSELAGLKYSMKNGILKISIDSPYIVNYPVDFLNIIRSNSGEVNISTKVLSAKASGGASSGAASGAATGSGGGGDSFSTGSKNLLKSNYDSDIWKSIETGVATILTSYTGTSTGLLIKSSPIDPALLAAGGVPDPSKQAPGSFVNINRQAGVVTVMATERKHREVKKYLDSIKVAQSAQVLIEAKILEVSLSDAYKNGIKWNTISSKSFEFDSPGDFSTPTDSLTDLLTVNVVKNELFGLDNISLDAVATFTEQFGTTRTLSSPRINAINNQQAVLTFAKNSVYFTIELEERTDTSAGGTQQDRSKITSTLNTVPIGVILTLQPSINLQTNEITMNIRPTLSRITGTVVDPGAAIIAQKLGSTSIKNEVPVIEVRELDSILKIRSGQVMVIGGLMENRTKNNESGVPGLNQLPIAGRLFNSRDDFTETIETVIFIKATLIPGSASNVEKTDKELYNKFSNDPRPLKF